MVSKGYVAKISSSKIDKPVRAGQHFGYRTSAKDWPRRVVKLVNMGIPEERSYGVLEDIEGGYFLKNG